MDDDTSNKSCLQSQLLVTLKSWVAVNADNVNEIVSDLISKCSDLGDVASIDFSGLVSPRGGSHGALCFRIEFWDIRTMLMATCQLWNVCPGMIASVRSIAVSNSRLSHIVKLSTKRLNGVIADYICETISLETIEKLRPDSASDIVGEYWRQFGDVESISESDGYVTVAYYDARAAQRARKRLDLLECGRAIIVPPWPRLLPTTSNSTICSTTNNTSVAWQCGSVTTPTSQDIFVAGTNVANCSELNIHQRVGGPNHSEPRTRFKSGSDYGRKYSCSEEDMSATVGSILEEDAFPSSLEQLAQMACSNPLSNDSSSVASGSMDSMLVEALIGILSSTGI